MEREFDFFGEQDDLLEGTINPLGERSLKVRLDKWLWAARFFKTRALARAAVEAGKVYYNGERSKPSREIEVGALLQIHQGRCEKTIIIKGLSTRRRSTEESSQLFEATIENSSARERFSQSPPAHREYSNFPSSGYPEQPQRRPVRFLRRSFMRQDPHHRSEPPQNNQKKEFEYWE